MKINTNYCLVLFFYTSVLLTSLDIVLQYIESELAIQRYCYIVNLPKVILPILIAIPTTCKIEFSTF